MSDATSILRKAGLRRTPVRTGVIELLTSSSSPMSVEELVAKLPRETDVVTVYRTLNTLVEKHLARRVRAEDRSWRFELSGAEHVHAHFVCDNCGKVECVPTIELQPSATFSAKLAEGYDIHSQELTLHGTCPKCHD